LKRSWPVWEDFGKPRETCHVDLTSGRNSNPEYLKYEAEVSTVGMLAQLQTSDSHLGVFRLEIWPGTCCPDRYFISSVTIGKFWDCSLK